MTAPPPDCSTSQNHSECGPECFSPCFTRCTRPKAPSSASCLAFTYLGAKNSSSPYRSSTPALRHASIIASASSSVRHNGFSHTTCLPALAASIVGRDRHHLDVGVAQQLVVVGIRARDGVPFRKVGGVCLRRGGHRDDLAFLRDRFHGPRDAIRLKARADDPDSYLQCHRLRMVGMTN